jgi:biotin carboxylase
MARVLVLATTTGYQTRAFGEAAERLGAELAFATDRCHLLDDPWTDHAIPIRFHDEDASVAAILDAAGSRRFDGVLAVGDRPTVIAARITQALGLPGHSPEAARVARHKLRTRECLRDAGLPVPWFAPVAISSRLSALRCEPSALTPQPLFYPCVLKPVGLSGSRGVMRANDPGELAAAFERLQALMQSPAIRVERDVAHDMALVEGFITGREYALEGLLHHGQLQTLALFDKPDPLDGPFFEETIYLAPSQASPAVHAAIIDVVTRAAAAIGLSHGPVHAECRVNESGASGEPTVYVLEVAARPIGGLCARALRFLPESATGDQPFAISLEELLLRHALGEAPSPYVRESAASGVMMIPIPCRGVLRGVDGVDAARAEPHVDDLRITAKADQLLVPLPEGASYLGFIFARAAGAGDVDRALRAAHRRLIFHVDPELPVLAPGQINYNLQHG